MSSAIVTMTEGRLGIALVGTADHLEGIITDGDLRRAIVNQVNFQQIKARDLMSPSPLSIMPDASGFGAAVQIAVTSDKTSASFFANKTMLCTFMYTVCSGSSSSVALNQLVSLQHHGSLLLI